MSEMLANQYFMVRRFSDAQIEFEKVLAENPANSIAKKKLIICLACNSKNKEALKLFYELIKEDITIITSTNIIEDDCPCPELITRIENITEPKLNHQSKLEILGMFWLYCDYNKSVQYFEKLKEFNPNEPIYSEILRIYKEFNLSKIS